MKLAYVWMCTNGVKEILKELFYYSSSQYMKLKYVVDLRLTNYKAGITRNEEYLRVLSSDLNVFIEINKYIFVVVRSKVPCMQS